MVDYKRMYIVLFNAITKALERLGRKDIAGAAEILSRAQTDTEEIYIQTSVE